MIDAKEIVELARHRHVYPWIMQLVFDSVELAVKREREACAKLLDEMAARDKLSNYYAVAAKAIRARNNT